MRPQKREQWFLLEKEWQLHSCQRTISSTPRRGPLRDPLSFTDQDPEVPRGQKLVPPTWSLTQGWFYLRCHFPFNHWWTEGKKWAGLRPWTSWRCNLTVSLSSSNSTPRHRVPIPYLLWTSKPILLPTVSMDPFFSRLILLLSFCSLSSTVSCIIN